MNLFIVFFVALGAFIVGYSFGVGEKYESSIEINKDGKTTTYKGAPLKIMLGLADDLCLERLSILTQAEID